MMQNRRTFLKQSFTLASGALLLPEILKGATAEREKLLILHTNDFHSHIDAFPANHPKWAGKGGASRMVSLMKKAAENQKNVLILDSGDMFQGTPYFNLFGGVAELEYMNKAGYMAGTLGNHEFDNGVEKLAEVLKHANFPIVNCNYNFGRTPLASLIKKYTVIEKGKFRVGITGVGIDLNGLVLANNCEGVQYMDPVKPLQETVNALRKNEKCNLVIVLSHLGFEYADQKIDDKKLAANTHGIDLILGGHTHTFLEAPVAVKNQKGRRVRINQAGWAGLQLGALEFQL